MGISILTETIVNFQDINTWVFHNCLKWKKVEGNVEKIPGTHESL